MWTANQEMLGNWRYMGGLCKSIRWSVVALESCDWGIGGLNQGFNVYPFRITVTSVHQWDPVLSFNKLRLSDTYCQNKRSSQLYQYMVNLDGCLPVVSVYNVELLLLNVSPGVLSSRKGFKDRIEDAHIIFNDDMPHFSSFSTNSPTLNFQNSHISDGCNLLFWSVKGGIL